MAEYNRAAQEAAERNLRDPPAQTVEPIIKRITAVGNIVPDPTVHR